jgi:hypothetical protein
LELCQFRNHRVAAAVCEIKSEQSALKRPGSLVNKNFSSCKCLRRIVECLSGGAFGDAAQQLSAKRNREMLRRHLILLEKNSRSEA